VLPRSGHERPPQRTCRQGNRFRASFYPFPPNFNAASNGEANGLPIGDRQGKRPRSEEMNKESAFIGGLLAIQLFLLPQLLLI
jgi:hypothetical protein